MKKQVVKLESLLTVISPAQIVRIMDETLTPKKNFVDPDEITAFKGTAAKAFREYAGKGATIKHISPEVERETGAAQGRYIMHVYIYQDPARQAEKRGSNHNEIIGTVKGHSDDGQDPDHSRGTREQGTRI